MPRLKGVIPIDIFMRMNVFDDFVGVERLRKW